MRTTFRQFKFCFFLPSFRFRIERIYYKYFYEVVYLCFYCCKFNCSYLGFFNGRIVPVAHWGNVQPGLALSIPLLEELLHYTLAPLPVQLKGLGGVGQVGAVDHVLQHLYSHNGKI